MRNKVLLIAMTVLMGINFNVNAVEVGQAAPLFSLPSLRQDQTVSLGQFNGKVVYVDFWASWCAPCRTSFPLLNKLQQKLKDQGFEVVAINLDEDQANAEKFLKDFPVTFTLLHDGKGEWADKYVVESMPTSFIVDRQGVIKNIHHGFTSDDMNELEQKIVQLLAKK